MRFKQGFAKDLVNEALTSVNLFKELKNQNVFDIIPIKVFNSHLCRAFIRGAIIPKVLPTPIGLPIGSIFKNKPNPLSLFNAERNKINSNKSNYSINNLGQKSEEFFEKHIEYLSHILEQHNNETWRWHCWLRSYNREKQQILSHLPPLSPDKLTDKYLQENYPSLAKLASSEPSRLESLIVYNQANTCCKQISKFSSNVFVNLYLSRDITSEKTP